jgi:adapter protein MecA 1/2
VEAMRVGVDSIVVIVTKITEPHDLEKKLSLIPQARSMARFKRKKIIETDPADSVDSISIFSFDTLDTATDAVSRLCGRFDGVSRVYKCDGRYFLLLQNETEDGCNTADIEAVLYEYGQKHVSNAISKQYLTERGDVLIAENAVEKLSPYS